jgi:hypothetical protein
MSGDAPYPRPSREQPPRRWSLSRRRGRGPARDQEDEVRARLYARPPATERTVEVLGPVEPDAERPAA